jgi:hypothetical protein
VLTVAAAGIVGGGRGGGRCNGGGGGSGGGGLAALGDSLDAIRDCVNGVRNQSRETRLQQITAFLGRASRCAYDTDLGMLICAVGDRLRMLTAHDDQSVAPDYDEADELARSVAAACRGNSTGNCYDP